MRAGGSDLLAQRVPHVALNFGLGDGAFPVEFER